ncbi:MAG: GMP synthase (glutamine-hydrolyzing) [Patiriisocius sp.]|jgi:GMP synthase (glutamine-hydrolysing)
MQEMILILDFGSQYTQLIARRIREHNVYCEIVPYNNVPKDLSYVKGVILSGSPFSVHDDDAPSIELENYSHVPVLGVCFGAQQIANQMGGQVRPSNTREYGRAHLSFVDDNNPLMKDVDGNSQVWMSHADSIAEVAENFNIIASTKDVRVAGYQVKGKDVYGIQFHPEVYHSEHGKVMLGNFLFEICNLEANWTPDSYVQTAVDEIKNTVGDDKVLLGLSGGVDSSVAAMLLHKAIGANLTCVFVDNGLLRKNEFTEVLESYKDMGLNVQGVEAKDKFYKALENLSDPEEKRKAIGKTFIDVFDQACEKLDDVKWLAQGTIYPDIIESVSVKGPSATIKSHHNVGGLPDYMKLKVIEPLKALFKDEVREVGAVLGLKKEILQRHPFPGPGLGIRILGDITAEKVRVLQEVDYIYINTLKEKGLYNDIWQAGSILLPVQSVGVMGDERTYEKAVALRAVTSTDGMTADWFHMPYDVLAEISNAIINKVKGVNRVVYDISSKPPATIEWE